jgi:Tfp pilus assembly protein PilV
MTVGILAVTKLQLASWQLQNRSRHLGSYKMAVGILAVTKWQLASCSYKMAVGILAVTKWQLASWQLQNGSCYLGSYKIQSLLFYYEGKVTSPTFTGPVWPRGWVEV